MSYKDAIIALDKIAQPITAARVALELAQSAEQSEREARENLRGLRAEINTADATRTALQAEIESGKAALEKFHREFSARKAELNAQLAAEMSQKRADALEALDADTKKLRAEQVALSEATSAANAVLNSTRAELSQLQDSIARLKSSVTNL